ncbi:hypothetical protein J5N97_009699 [Dioscorea zingiberensis]|uniref:Uncharacterized protein n=1 Tax=Dioscorea zingiberensis TaxID=325984 RepID=A0A9D5CYU5_9LILI|nr:hypothetical protein J5N97_009699 [Dioscorea zingiberensis]
MPASAWATFAARPLPPRAWLPPAVPSPLQPRRSPRCAPLLSTTTARLWPAAPASNPPPCRAAQRPAPPWLCWPPPEPLARRLLRPATTTTRRRVEHQPCPLSSSPLLCDDSGKPPQPHPRLFLRLSTLRQPPCFVSFSIRQGILQIASSNPH